MTETKLASAKCRRGKCKNDVAGASIYCAAHQPKPNRLSAPL